jgi:hypothetical protein
MPEWASGVRVAALIEAAGNLEEKEEKRNG